MDDPVLILKFLGDLVERRHCHDVCARFPNYAKLWATFIGNKNEPGRAESWDLVFPRNTSSSEERKTREKWEKFCMHHYHLFCNLVGMRLEKSYAEEAFHEKDRADKLIKHWEAIESFYSDLGSAYFMWKRMWATISVSGGLKSLRRRRKVADNSLKRIEKILIIRHNKVHFARTACRMDKSGSYLIKNTIKKDETWSEYRKRRGEEITTIEKMQRDLETAEKSFNKLHEYLFREVKKFFAEHRLEIKVPAKTEPLLVMASPEVYVDPTAFVTSKNFGSAVSSEVVTNSEKTPEEK